MGKDIKGKELGVGISQRREDGLYVGRYTNKCGKRIQKLFSNSLLIHHMPN